MSASGRTLNRAQTWMSLIETGLVSSVLWTASIRLTKQQIVTSPAVAIAVPLLCAFTALLAWLQSYWATNSRTSSKTLYRSAKDAGLALGALVVPLVVAILLLDSTQRGDIQDYLLAIFETSLINGFIFLARSVPSSLLVRQLIHATIPGVLSILLICKNQLPLAIHDMPLWWITTMLAGYPLMEIMMARIFRLSFTMGELAVLVQTMTLLSGDVMLSTLPWTPSRWLDLQRPPLLIFLEAATVGMLLYGLIISPIIAKVVGDPTTLNHSSTAKVQRHWTPYRIWLFYAGSLLVAGGILLPWIGWKIQCEPFTWVFTLLFTGQRKLVLCGAWIVAILFSVLLFNKLDSSMTKEAQKTHTKAQLYLRRKFFHALSIFMFTPGILYEPQFMHLAFSVSICAFILLEYLRTLRVPPLGEALHAFFTRFLDHRDAGPIILAHVYLLLGCAVPLWLYGGAANSEARLAVLAGIITLGFGDAMASTIGIRYGRHRWPGTNKTIEGTFAFILCTQLSPWVLGLRLSVSQFPALLIITTLAGALECVSQQNDNLLLPPVIFAAFRLAHL